MSRSDLRTFTRPRSSQPRHSARAFTGTRRCRSTRSWRRRTARIATVASNSPMTSGTTSGRLSPHVNAPPSMTAVVDTDVYTLVFLRKDSPDPRVPGRRQQLVGRRALATFQTRVELLGLVATNTWGERRTSELRAQLGRTVTIGVDDSVIEGLRDARRRMSSRRSCTSAEATHRRPLDRCVRHREGRGTTRR